MPVNCDLTDLIVASKSYQDFGLGADEREAIMLYLYVQALTGAGGTDFSSDLTALLEAAKDWQVLAQTQLNAINLLESITNAQTAGATFDDSPSALKAAARCYLCLSDNRRSELLLFLRCSLSNLGIPS